MPRDKTAVEVNALRRKPGVWRVAANLYLLVRPAKGGGVRASWTFRFETSDGGKRRKGTHMGLGSCQTFTLAEARERARKLRQQLAEGVNPLQAKKAAKTAKKLEAARSLTFGQAAAQLIATHHLSWRSKKHAAQWVATFRGSSRAKAATECINNLPVASVDTALALKVLQPLWAKTPQSAARVRQRCEVVISWASAQQLREGPNPFQWRGHLDRILPQPRKLRGVQHHPSLPYTEIGALMAELRANNSISSLALQFTILTACRTNEAINATWSEVSMESRTWIIPPTRTKSGKEHRVPLSDAALEVLEALPRESGSGDYLFIGARRGKPLSNAAMLQLMQSLRPGYVPHGLRATFRTWVAECCTTHYPHVVAELALGHTQNDKLMQAYQRGDLISKRTQLMREWAAYCVPSAVAAGNVVSLLKKKADAS